jgi:hypothetical protein
MTEDMANFKILLTPWHGTLIAPPYIDSTFTEDIKSKNPYNNPVYSNDWFNYTPMRAGKPVPLTDNYKLPAHFYWICSNVKKLGTDYYSHSKGVILSSCLFKFLKQFNCYDEYDICEVTPLSRKLAPISDKKYYFIRFKHLAYNLFIDLENSNRIKRMNKVITSYLYLDFQLREQTVYPDIFWMKNVLVAKDSVADLINRNGFSGFRMVELKDFVDEYTFRDTHPYPTLEDMKDRDRKWF